MIKICAIDLDGTLFDERKYISDENKKAIMKAEENGCKVVIATGRPINGVMPVIKHLNLLKPDDYVICYNGAKVYSITTGNLIYASTLSGKDVKELYYESKKLNVYFHAFRKNEELVTDIANPYTAVEETINKLTATIIDFSKIDDNEEFLKCMMVGADEDITTAMKNLDQRHYNQYCVVRSSKIFLEFLNKETNKGSALENLANYLNVQQNETMAIGDAGNDYAMIKYAGVGVAMANAYPEIKEIANYVTSSNEESGVAKAINLFVNDPLA